MRIGILTFHWATNYGAIIQAYALQEFLKSQGHDVEIINYKPRKYDFSIKHWFYPIRNIRNLSIKKELISKKKESLLRLFRKDYLNLTKRYDTLDELMKENFTYNVVICGSDQILNPSFLLYGEDTITPTYFLSFVNNRTKKVGYAVSFGCTEYPQEALRYAQTEIKDFKCIGVRERTGIDILNQMNFCGNSRIVPDPTILIGDKLFDKIKIDKSNLPHNYVCIYMLRTSMDLSDIYNNVVYIDDTKKAITLEKWLGLISSARTLVTNSYHGMIMAILFHVPFIVMLEQSTKTVGMNDRFFTLLNLLGLTDRIVNTKDELNKILMSNVVWNMVDVKMKEFRKIGENFLKIDIYD